MKLTLAFSLLAFSVLPSPAHAESENEIVNLPAGQMELTDLMSPEEIYADSLAQGSVNEADLQDLDASSTSASSAHVYIYVSKSQQHLWVYQDGQLVPGMDWPVSTGTEQMRCPPHAACRIAHTPTGVRHPGSLDWEHFSRLYDNAPMHRAIQFVGGVYLHATYGAHLAHLGQRDSGGCVRQLPANAERLFLFVKEAISRYTRQGVVIEISER